MYNRAIIPTEMSTQNEDIGKDDPLAELFENATDITLDEMLPTKGKCYPKHPGTIKVNALTYEDEKVLANTAPKDFINTMISQCVSPIDVDSLVAVDKLFILFKIRQASFGSTVNMVTPCKACSHQNSLEVHLSDLPVEYVDDTFDGTVSGELPKLGKEVVVRIPSTKEYNISNVDRLSNLWRYIQKIGPIEDKKLISKAVKRLTVADIRYIQGLLSLDEYGIQTNALYKCSDCGTENVAAIPITNDFFTVS